MPISGKFNRLTGFWDKAIMILINSIRKGKDGEEYACSGCQRKTFSGWKGFSVSGRTEVRS
ncbi:MAG: hypothetical protein ACOX1I_01895 [Dethiobacteria bacterium]